VTGRWSWRDPKLRLAVLLGIVIGGFGAAYPTSFLGETHAPGLAAGLLLGIAGVLATSPLWALVLAAASGGDSGSAGIRVLAHAHGRSQLVTRSTEVGNTLLLAMAAALSGAVGGLISALAQAETLASAKGLFSLAPSWWALTIGVGALIASAALGYLIGVAAGQTSVGVLVVVCVIAASAILVGAAYFAPATTSVVSATPAGILMVVARSNFLAPQFTNQLSPSVAWVAAPVWVLLIVGFAVKRVVGRVA
jgi:hypothetical protein